MERKPFPARTAGPEGQLTRLPTGYRHVIIATDVMVMNPTTGAIYDIVQRDTIKR
jgi:hypothetical protein